MGIPEKQLCISVGRLDTDEIVWPILEDSGKAIRVDFSGIQIWIPIYWFSQHSIRLSLMSGGLRFCRVDNQRTADNLLGLFRLLSKTSSSAVIPVKRAGCGPTEKSARVKFTVSVGDDEFMVAREQSMTVPVSQIVEIHGKPHLNARVVRKKCPAIRLPNTFTPAIDMAIKQIEEFFAGRWPAV